MAETKADTQVVGYEVQNGVAWIRFNRPESMNAVNTAMRKALGAAIRQAERDEAARVVVLTGAGRAFCAGADVREFGTRESDIGEIARDYEAMLLRLRTMPKPTIAALNGVAAGVGASIALLCDLRFAVPEAYFVEAFVKIGLTVDGGVSWLLPRLIGMGRALEMFYTGDPLAAEEAHRAGVVNRLIEAERLEEAVREFAERLAAGPTMALAAIKRSVNYAMSATLEESVEFEFHLQGVQLQGEDSREGVAAFLEKRQPRFQGR